MLCIMLVYYARVYYVAVHGLESVHAWLRWWRWWRGPRRARCPARCCALVVVHGVALGSTGAWLGGVGRQHVQGRVGFDGCCCSKPPKARRTANRGMWLVRMPQVMLFDPRVAECGGCVHSLRIEPSGAPLHALAASSAGDPVIGACDVVSVLCCSCTSLHTQTPWRLRRGARCRHAAATRRDSTPMRVFRPHHCNAWRPQRLRALSARST